MDSKLLTTFQIKNVFNFIQITTEWLCIQRWCHEVLGSPCTIHEIKKRLTNIYESQKNFKF